MSELHTNNPQEHAYLQGVEEGKKRANPQSSSNNYSGPCFHLPSVTCTNCAPPPSGSMTYVSNVSANTTPPTTDIRALTTELYETLDLRIHDPHERAAYRRAIDKLLNTQLALEKAAHAYKAISMYREALLAALPERVTGTPPLDDFDTGFNVALDTITNLIKERDV